MLDPQKWMRGMEKVRLLHLLWIPHFRRAHHHFRHQAVALRGA